jgi:DNA invertase Pin-like site-specific DNA recombinase
MQSAKAITCIPARKKLFSTAPLDGKTKRRVAAYARVSTDSAEQMSSYEAQVDYYTRLITEKPEWKFVKVYTDEGISGTTTRHRAGFKEMVSDSLGGKVDLIITKSVSRFARNTVDSLTTVRQLKEKGVEIYFEKENIYTLDAKGELLITIMSSLAQEESRSISENVTWGQRKRMADGKVTLPYARFLGYKKGENNLPQIVEEEAKIVRLIYQLFLEGKTPGHIAKYLTGQNIPTPAGKKIWPSNTVLSILTNEKYKGEALLQKAYTVNFLTKKRKINEGEVPQYYVEKSHPAIVSPEVFDLAQEEVRRRKGFPSLHSSVGVFSSKLVCGECGSYYGSKVWHSNDKYRRIIYQCNNKYKNGEKCRTPHLDEQTIKELFVSAINRLIENKGEIFDNFKIMDTQFFDTTALGAEMKSLSDEIEILEGLMQKCVEENAHSILDQGEYQERYGALAAKHETAKNRLAELEVSRKEKKGRRSMAKAFLSKLQEQDTLITDFDEQLWHSLVDHVKVGGGGDIRFVFRDGTVS